MVGELRKASYAMQAPNLRIRQIEILRYKDTEWRRELMIANEAEETGGFVSVNADEIGCGGAVKRVPGS